MVLIRTARRTDERPLAEIDQRTWSWDVAPGPLWPAGRDFFGKASPDDVLVAVDGGAVVGYAGLGHPTELESNRHVLQIGGLAVDPAAHRRGVGRALIEAAVAEAARRGARRLTLRVLGRNTAAQALYTSCGFEVEGVLQEEFWLDGRFVDDVLMARRLERRPMTQAVTAAIARPAWRPEKMQPPRNVPSNDR